MNLSTPRPSPRHTQPRGLATIEILVGTLLASIVIGGFMLFWLNGRDVQTSTSDMTRQEASGLAALNRISDDISDSSAVALASETELVLVQPQEDGTTTWVRYALTDDGNLYKQELPNAPRDYTNAETAFPAPPSNGFIVREVESAETGDAFFTYTDAAGGALAAGTLYNPGPAADISLVDIAFAAQVDTVGDDTTNTVELHTSASVKSTPGGQVDPIRPACPVVRFAQGDPYPVLAWSMTGQTTSFNITRTGSGGIGLPTATWTENNVTTAQETITFSDPDIAGPDPSLPDNQAATQPVNYTVTAVGPGGESVNCSAATWYPRLARPTVTARLLPITPEPTDWPTTWVPGDSSYARLSWPSVGGARFYEIYRRPLAVTDKFAGTYDPAGEFTLLTTLTDASPDSAGEQVVYRTDIADDTGWAYRVVAWGPMPESSPRTAGIPIVGHTAKYTGVETRVEDRDVNHVTWSGEPGETATLLGLWRRDLSGCNPAQSAWTLVERFDLDTTEYTDRNAAAGTRYEYAVAPYNYGPRGTDGNANPIGPQRYAAQFSGTDTSLQYPANPTTAATGSSGGPAPAPISSPNTNRVSVTPGCAATTDSTDLSIWHTLAGNPVEIVSGITGTFNDTGVPRATRRWYKAVAFNETGASANALTGTTGAVAAYQWPNKPDAPQLAGGGLIVGQSSVTVTTAPGTPPPASEGSCTKTGSTYTWTKQQSFGHPAGAGYNTADINDPEGSMSTDHYHFVPTPTGDQYSCRRYQGTASFTWPGTIWQHNGTPGGGFCGTAGSNCSYQVRFNYTTPAGQVVPGTCNAAYSATTCSVTFYSGSTTQQNYTVDGTSLRLVATNAGGSAISDEPVVPNQPPAVVAPTDPAFTVLGSSSNDDGTNARNVGRNTIFWAPAKNAPTGYRVYAYRTYSGGNVTDASPRLVYQGAPVTQAGSSGMYTHSVYDTNAAVGRGTETYYRVVAYNAAGNSPGSNAKRPAYQLPAAVTMTQVGSWNQVENTITWGWNAAADAGMPSTAKFCATGRGNCSQTLLSYDKIDKTYTAIQEVPTSTQQVTTDVPLGTDTAFAMRVCNTGGCVQTPPVECSPLCSTAPGPYTLVNHGGSGESRGIKWSGDTLIGDPDKWGTLAPLFSPSKGAESWRFGRTVVSADPHNRVRPDGWSAGSYNTAVGPADQDGTTPTSGPASRRAPQWRSTPSAVYRYYVWSVGKNGKTRAQEFVILAQPPKVQFAQTGLFCNLNARNEGDWKLGWQTYPHAVSGEETVRFDKLKYLVWAGQLTTKEWESGDQNSDSGVAMQNARRLAGLRYSGTSLADEYADDTENGYFPNSGVDANGNWNNFAKWKPETWNKPAERPNFADPGGTGLWQSTLPGNRGYDYGGPVLNEVFGNQNDDYALPSLFRVTASLQFFTWNDPTRYSVDGGQFASSSNRYAMPRSNEMLASSSGACNSSGTWRANTWRNTVGRWSSNYNGYRADGKWGSKPTVAGNYFYQVSK